MATSQQTTEGQTHLLLLAEYYPTNSVDQGR
jgi:hypothetical protein